MIGTTLKNLLDEREIKVNEFARQIKVPAQTLYSIIRRDNMKIDFELLLRICDALHVPLETFCGTGSTGQPTPEEWETLWKLRRLDDHGRFVTLQLLDAECARLQAAQRQPERNKIIPLYMTPAAAGYASPALGDDYEDYEVAADRRRTLPCASPVTVWSPISTTIPLYWSNAARRFLMGTLVCSSSMAI